MTSPKTNNTLECLLPSCICRDYTAATQLRIGVGADPGGPETNERKVHRNHRNSNLWMSRTKKPRRRGEEVDPKVPKI